MRKSYTSLDGLAAAIGLPRPYLRDLASKRLIPVLDVNGRLRFDEDHVREALRDLAANGAAAEPAEAAS